MARFQLFSPLVYSLYIKTIKFLCKELIYINFYYMLYNELLIISIVSNKITPNNTFIYSFIL
jgi:hypothetical protein